MNDGRLAAADRACIAYFAEHSTQLYRNWAEPPPWLPAVPLQRYPFKSLHNHRCASGVQLSRLCSYLAVKEPRVEQQAPKDPQQPVLPESDTLSQRGVRPCVPVNTQQLCLLVSGFRSNSQVGCWRHT